MKGLRRQFISHARLIFIHRIKHFRLCQELHRIPYIISFSTLLQDKEKCKIYIESKERCKYISAYETEALLLSKPYPGIVEVLKINC